MEMKNWSDYDKYLILADNSYGKHKIKDTYESFLNYKIVIDVINRIKSSRSDIALSSDFIVGFPGETDKDFENTMRFVEKVNFVIAYSFMYSPRPGTPAQKKDNIDITTKKAIFGAGCFCSAGCF